MIHKIKGTIIHGNCLGRELGFPTANIAITPDTPVRDGVYIAEVNVDGGVWRAMVNIGARPTIEGAGGRFVEAHLFNFSDDIYGKEIIVFLLGYLRSEIKFGGLDELKKQLEQDKETIISYFNSPQDEANQGKFKMPTIVMGHPLGGHPHGASTQVSHSSEHLHKK